MFFPYSKNNYILIHVTVTLMLGQNNVHFPLSKCETEYQGYQGETELEWQVEARSQDALNIRLRSLEHILNTRRSHQKV